MKEWNKLMMIAVTTISLAVVITAVVSLINMGKGLLNKGTDMLNDSTQSLMDFDITQYEDTNITGAQLITLIKKYWQPDNVVSVTVCTKDGCNLMYDYSGTIFAMNKELVSWSANDARKQTLATLDASGSVSSVNIKQMSKATHETSIKCYDDNSGYKEEPTKSAGYINRVSGLYRGKVQYDSNDVPRNITFVQQ